MIITTILTIYFWAAFIGSALNIEFYIDKFYKIVHESFINGLKNNFIIFAYTIVALVVYFIFSPFRFIKNIFTD